MMLVRPVSMEDHGEILHLAHEAGIGMTSLPPDAEVLEQKIARSVASFEGKSETKGHERFLFVLEDVKAGKLVGSAGIVAHVGMSHPFYSYKLSTIVQASDKLGIYSLQRVLHMVNDYTGASEIGSLFLVPSYRRDGIGRFLSRSRYLMLAEFPDLFSEVVISEIRGGQDEQGESPFYKNLAQHFFQMDFKRADFTNATQGGQFISDLMPKYPIYVNLLDKRAQEAIGQPLEASKPAKQLLEAEGFRYQGYIDVFDAGPTMQAERSQIRTVRKSRRAPLLATKDIGGKATHILSNTLFKNFRMVFAALEETADGVAISAEAAKALNIKQGRRVALHRGVMDPIAKFHGWFKAAKACNAIADATAMCLATSDGKQPSARMVLLKHADERGFVFYTNNESRKSGEIKKNPFAALCFYWMPLDKQVRIEGKIEKVSDKEADDYFASRARESQIGAWSSKQSEPLDSRDTLVKAVAQNTKKFEGKPVPRPPHWSGWRVVPEKIEFWEQGTARLHERELFTRDGKGWRVMKLYP